MWEYIALFNESKVAWAFAVLLTNIGAKYLSLQINASEYILKTRLFKYVIIVSLMFVTTRDLLLSISISTLVMAFMARDGMICVTPSCYFARMLFQKGPYDDDDDDRLSDITI
jgi:hypothetical protein